MEGSPHLLDEELLARASSHATPAELEAHLAACFECRSREWVLRNTREGEPTHRTPPASAQPAGVAPPSPGAPPATPPLERGKSIGRYLVVGVLGEGGMGVVYSAYDPELHRRVAIKLVRAQDSEEASHGQARLLREAQAMAQLSHPNVVTVFDVGTFEHQVFLAMELVEGVNGKEWLLGELRSWQEALEVYLAAGDGLAAAHASGLIHRDFKPENLLVSPDGRVRVTDFGLARAEVLRQNDSEVTDPGEMVLPGATAKPADLTLAGAVMGTPAYMAPEQFLGRADARSDQFAFCVALYRALYRQRPYPKPDLGNPLASFHQPPAPPPPGSTVPAWVRAVLTRGLSANADERFPSMAELLVALRKDHTPRKGRRLALAGMLAAVVAMAGLAVSIARRPTGIAICDEAAPLAGIRDATAQARLEASFTSAGPRGTEAWARIRAMLDRHAQDWQARRSAECPRGHGAGAEQMVRLACLESVRAELGQLTGSLATIEPGQVVRAPAAVSELTRSSECGRGALRRTEPPPPAVAEQVAELERQLARARGLRDSGQIAQAEALLRPVAEASSEIRYRPLESEAWLELGRLLLGADDGVAAVPVLERAVSAAEAGGGDRIEAIAASLLAGTEGYLARNRDAGQRWLQRARNVLERMHGDDRAEAAVKNADGALQFTDGRLAAAEALVRQSLELTSSIDGPDAITTLKAHTTLAAVLHDLGQFDQALAEEELLDHRYAELYGRALPERTLVLVNLCTSPYELGLYPEALSACIEAASLAEPESRRQAWALEYQSRTLRALGRASEAVPMAEHALTIEEAKSGLASDEWADTLLYVAAAHRDAGHPEQALVELTRALDIRERTIGPESADLAETVLELAETQLQLGQAAAAVPSLQRALGLMQKRAQPPGALARVRFDLARGQMVTGTDPAAVLSLARQALTEWAPLPTRARELAALRSWMEENHLQVVAAGP